MLGREGGAPRAPEPPDAPTSHDAKRRAREARRGREARRPPATRDANIPPRGCARRVCGRSDESVTLGGVRGRLSASGARDEERNPRQIIRRNSSCFEMARLASSEKATTPGVRAHSSLPTSCARSFSRPTRTSSPLSPSRARASRVPCDTRARAASPSRAPRTSRGIANATTLSTQATRWTTPTTVRRIRSPPRRPRSPTYSPPRHVPDRGLRRRRRGATPRASRVGTPATLEPLPRGRTPPRTRDTRTPSPSSSHARCPSTSPSPRDVFLRLAPTTWSSRCARATRETETETGASAKNDTASPARVAKTTPKPEPSRTPRHRIYPSSSLTPSS